MLFRYFIGIVLILTLLVPIEIMASDRIDYDQIVYFDIARDNCGDIEWFESENEYNYKGYIKGVIIASPYRLTKAEAKDCCLGYQMSDSLYFKPTYYRLNSKMAVVKLNYLYVLKRSMEPKKINGKFEFIYKIREYELEDGVFRLRIYKYQDQSSFTSN